MKIAELLRTMLDAAERSEVVDQVSRHRDDLQNFASAEEVESNNIEDPHELFMPPLQMKLELLKKAVGVENVYDDGSTPDRGADPDEECEYVGDPESQQDTSFETELSQLKKSAGLNPGIVQELSNDEPLDD